jgi:hypothetical protein
MTDDRPIFRKIIDAIHALQARTATIEERSAAWKPSWPAAVSRSPRFGVAIDRFRCVYAAHHPLERGRLVVFGEEERRIKSAKVFENDIGIAEWEEPIKTKPMPLLPWDWNRFLAVYRDQWTLKRALPAWRCDQMWNIVPMRITALSSQFYFDRSFGPGVQLGDSGGPVFLWLDEPVLIGVTGTRGGGPSLAHHWSLIKMWAPEVREAIW